MKILVGIPHFDNKRDDLLQLIINEYDRVAQVLPAEVTVIVYLKTPATFHSDQIKVYQKGYLIENNNGWHLTSPHRYDFFNLINEYDLFIYCEDDVLITVENLQYFLEHSSRLKQEFVPGFLRWEEMAGERRLTDISIANSYFRGGTIVSFRCDDYFEPTNIHQGCYCLTNSHLQTVISSGKYLQYPRYVGCLEGIATDAYYDCGLSKAISISDIHRSLIHHMGESKITKDNLTVEQLLNEVNKYNNLS